MTRRSGRKPLAVRLYGAATRLLPGALGRLYAAEAERLFAELYEDAIRRGGRTAGWTLWARSTLLLIACAIRERAEDRGRRRRGGDGMGALLHDIRYALRTLAKRPSFSLTAIAILGIGIGATTGIFSVVDTVVLRPLPYPGAGRLVHFDNGAHSFPSLRAWRAMSSFETLAAARDFQVDLTGAGEPERLQEVSVSRDFFRVFGGAPYLGRLFDSEDYANPDAVVVLDHGFWMRRWGGDPDVLGTSLVVDGTPRMVVGVLDPDFHEPEIETGTRVDLWSPLDEGTTEANDHGLHVLGVVGRLADSVSLEAAQAEVDAQREAIAAEHPENYVSRQGELDEVPLVPLREATVRSIRSTLLTLLGAVGLLLLIACANVANLFLAHGTARMREVSLRAALGATRLRLGRQVLTESVLLALAGGALGVVLAYGGVDLFARFNPGGIPRIENLAVDTRVLTFSLLIASFTGVLFGALPAIQAMRSDVNEALKDGSTTATLGAGVRRLRSALVVSEIALAVLLVTGAGLLLRSFVARVQVDPGFEVENLVVLPLRLGADYDETARLQLTDAVLAQVRAMPQVREAAAGWTSPFQMTGRNRCCWRTRVVGDPVLSSDERPFRGITHPVTPGYFSTLGAPLVSGREFEPADADAAVAVLNRPAAVALFGTEDVVGRTITLGGAQPTTLDVVGVVEGVHHWGATEGVENAVYVTYARYGGDFDDLQVIVRTDADLETIAAALREAVWSLDPDLPITEVSTMERRVSASVATPRFLTGLLGGFAFVALVLACGGIYGSMLYTVSQRRREMGIRLALGAAGRDVVRLVLGQGLALALTGVLVGTLAALGASRVLQGLLWGVAPTDPLTYAGVALVLSAAAGSAAFLPAWRAGRTDPLETLKAE